MADSYLALGVIVGLDYMVVIEVVIPVLKNPLMLLLSLKELLYILLARVLSPMKLTLVGVGVRMAELGLLVQLLMNLLVYRDLLLSYFEFNFLMSCLTIDIRSLISLGLIASSTGPSIDKAGDAFISRSQGFRF